jgi:[protein-PII] uridylyltransferase
LCPGSDVDVVLVHDGAADLATVAERLWYPLWDAGFVLGHAANTVKQEVALAERDLHALTAMLDARLVAGDSALFDDLVARIRRLAERRRGRLVDDLRSAADARREKFGLLAEMLEPDLKDAGGGLRDLQSLSWAGWTLGEPGGLAVLVGRGYLRPRDPARLAAAMRRIQARARRVLWLNPLLGDPRYEPTARGMAAALPFVDALLPVHDLESLERLLPQLAP